ncbi:MAG: hypothetical protein B7Y02_01385, partial [Rhodobacterales bacterium 17-64-5]
MPHDGQTMTKAAMMPDVLDLTAAVLPELDGLFASARETLRARVTAAGRLSAPALEVHQHQAHGVAWLATYVEGLRQLRAWAGRVAGDGHFTEMEALI